MALLTASPAHASLDRHGAPRRLLIATFLLLSAFAEVGAQPHEPPSEQEVKAVFLFHFTRFVTWPATVMSDRQRPFAICVFGESALGEALETVVAGETVEGKPIRVVLDVAATQAASCQMVYVAEPREGAVRQLLGRLAGAPILTVGDGEQFLELGGMVRFVTRRNRVQLEIAPAAAARARLRISSRLLSLARLEPGGER